MNILYLHGYASCYKPDTDKVIALEQLGPVSGIDLDYTEGPDAVIEAALEATTRYNTELLVGTSMGGWLASQVALRTGLPFVALNPATDPAESLQKYIGQPIDFTGTAYVIDAQTVSAYPPLARDAHGLVLCQSGDDVIDAQATHAALSRHYHVELLPGGSHRFENLDLQLDQIVSHYQAATTG